MSRCIYQHPTETDSSTQQQLNRLSMQRFRFQTCAGRPSACLSLTDIWPPTYALDVGFRTDCGGTRLFGVKVGNLGI